MYSIIYYLVCMHGALPRRQREGGGGYFRLGCHVRPGPKISGEHGPRFKKKRG